jgi:hypothetical protein
VLVGDRWRRDVSEIELHADGEGSIALYELLGFAVSDTYRTRDRLDWAALESGQARLMLAHAEEPIVAAAQRRAVLPLHGRPSGAADASARGRAGRRRDP